MHVGPQACMHASRQKNMLARGAGVVHARFMLIAVVNQKGGVGKTTLAVHLAVWQHEQGRRVAFIDADGQSSSSRWIHGAEADMTLVAATQADEIIEQAVALRTSHDVVIADGPANLAEATRALLLVADLALIPCGVSIPELESTADTVRILRSAQVVRAVGIPAALLVLTRLRSDRFHLTREAPNAAKLLGLPVCSNVLRLREPIADAPGQRSVAWRMGPRARTAASELNALFEEISAYAEFTPEHDSDAHHRAAGISPAGLV